jgi:hypothetical protein
MLRPATPLTVLLLAAFVLLLISVISTPIVKSIPLATYDGVDYGVFGYCTKEGCSKIEIGYNFGQSRSRQIGFRPETSHPRASCRDDS